ncbi:MAG: aminotransferase class IV, partial [Phycisphaerales bacterium]|nr:aminotransferase class IV [Phycisphaerales bacterium]
EHVVGESGLTKDGGRARVRLTVTGGDLNMLSRGEGAPPPLVDPTVMIVAQAAPAYPAQMFEQGVGVTIARFRANPLDPFAGHKTLNYWARLNELRVAATKHAAEAIVLQVTNHIAGGCVSNLFAVVGGRLITPIARGEEHADAVPSPVLPGITRGSVVAFAQEKRMGVEARMMSISDVLDADEVFLTNSSWGVLPVVRIEDKAIGSGMPGGVTREIRGMWAQSVAAG